MTERDVGAGWKLIDWEGDWAPQLQNERNQWWMEVDDDGRFVVTDERRDFDRGVVYAPLAAVQELIAAHVAWKKAKEPAPVRQITCEDVGCPKCCDPGTPSSNPTGGQTK